MSHTLIAYYDADQDAVVVASETGAVERVLDLDDAACLGTEILAAARREDTGYGEFLAQING